MNKIAPILCPNWFVIHINIGYCICIGHAKLVGSILSIYSFELEPILIQDKDGNGPLHVLAMLNPNDDDAPRLLLDSGTRPDRVNREKKTAADVWMENHGLEIIQKSCLPYLVGCVRMIQCRN